MHLHSLIYLLPIKIIFVPIINVNVKNILLTLTGMQISLKILPTCTSIQKSQPTFPNPTRIKGGTGG
ncbi:MAG: hypothetical protein CMG74_02165 [Candidatus Marinimicrobia bacterium]|nr:hypothetical protein [Candidatus Neomarinimicrobiota bacterium]